ncbi:MAG: nuclear transport factor 2 family protein [Bryobacterales bacterium]
MTEWIGILVSGLALAAAGSTDAESEVRAAMIAWKEATLGKDGAALDSLLHQDLTYSHSNGRTQTKDDVVSSVAGGKSSVTGIDFGDPTVRVYGTTALVKGIVDVHNSKDGVTATAHLDILHVWIKGPRGWQMVARQATQATA